MKKSALAISLAVMSMPAFAQTGLEPADAVSQDRLRADVETLVSFGTRHTLSSVDDPERGIGAARRWARAEFEQTSRACDGCLTIVTPSRMETGNRIPEPALIENVVAIQRGSERPDEVVIVQAHIDSRASDVMDALSDAPGANDDGSGSALVLEAARLLSQRQFPTTIVYALLTGEEQGLFGGSLMADYALERGWTVKAVLNNDIVGGSCGSDGYCDDSHVRVFSEGPRADLTGRLRSAQRRNGGENDSPSRNLSRWLARLAEADAAGLSVRQIWRADRMGRGGDHLPFLERGLPAVRLSVAVEDYEHQHQDVRVEDGVTYGDTVDEMDFAYLARVTRLNVRALDALAGTPMPPAMSAQAAVRTDTLLQWDGVAGASFYVLRARRTDEPHWTRAIAVMNADAGQGDPADGDPAARPGYSYTVPLRGDDWIFGIAACSFGSICSPFASAVPAGAFEPVSGAEE